MCLHSPLLCLVLEWSDCSSDSVSLLQQLEDDMRRDESSRTRHANGRSFVGFHTEWLSIVRITTRVSERTWSVVTQDELCKCGPRKQGILENVDTGFDWFYVSTFWWPQRTFHTGKRLSDSSTVLPTTLTTMRTFVQNSEPRICQSEELNELNELMELKEFNLITNSYEIPRVRSPRKPAGCLFEANLDLWMISLSRDSLWHTTSVGSLRQSCHSCPPDFCQFTTNQMKIYGFLQRSCDCTSNNSEIIIWLQEIHSCSCPNEYFPVWDIFNLKFPLLEISSNQFCSLRFPMEAVVSIKQGLLNRWKPFKLRWDDNELRYIRQGTTTSKWDGSIFLDGNITSNEIILSPPNVLEIYASKKKIVAFRFEDPVVCNKWFGLLQNYLQGIGDWGPKLPEDLTLEVRIWYGNVSDFLADFTTSSMEGFDCIMLCEQIVE